MTISERQEKFIVEYLKEYTNVSVYDEGFHDVFHEKFGGVFKETSCGTRSVNKAMQKLKSMWKEDKLDRCSTVYDMDINTKPTWGYLYWLHDKFTV